MAFMNEIWPKFAEKRIECAFLIKKSLVAIDRHACVRTTLVKSVRTHIMWFGWMILRLLNTKSNRVTYTYIIRLPGCVFVCVYACYRPETMSHFNIILSSYYVILCTCHDINTDINFENWPNPRNTICSTILFEYHIQMRTNTDVTILNKRTFSMSN